MYEFLDKVLETGGSDLHLSSKNIPAIRIDGDLVRVGNKNLPPEYINDFAKKLLPKDKIKIFLAGNEVDYSFYHNNCRFRINCFHGLNGPAISFRCLRSEILSLEDIMAPEILKKFCEMKKGLVIVSGATGSGKSTTLSAMIQYINQHYSKHIIAVEDPVEYIHKSDKSLIEQIEVGRNTKSFSHALKNLMRQDPDVIMVGEVRDLETIHLALTAAETGHLVFATMHTNSAYQAINRIIDVFPENDKNTIRSILSLSLRGVICQKLIKKRNGGRCAAFEIMVINSAIQNLIRTDSIHNIQSNIETGSRYGMITMQQYIQKLLDNNIIEQFDSI